MASSKDSYDAAKAKDLWDTVELVGLSVAETIFK